jgi:flagellar L-ring protein FlgH
MKQINAWVVICGVLCASPGWAADLYQEGQYRSLVSDVKARKIGDSLTVLVMETSSAASSADTNTKRNTEVGAIGMGDVKRQSIKGEINNEFSGAARTQRAGRLLAQLTVTVIGIEANGDLRVSGEQLLEVNNEKQTIRLEGKVRPYDIGENNAVVSNRIADAKIHYVGDGVLADGQRPGWITRVLTWLGL